jgi:hypothetical protein
LNGVRPGPVSGGQALSSDECRQLGGTVTLAVVCKMGLGCATTDNKGVKHEMCVTKY